MPFGFKFGFGFVRSGTAGDIIGTYVTFQGQGVSWQGGGVTWQGNF